MTMTASISKADVIRAANKRWRKAKLIENPKAATPEGKAKAAERRKTLQAELDATAKQLDALGGFSDKLLTAAEFALDVDGDEPSWGQLREAVEHGQRFKALAERKKALRAEVNELAHVGYRHRYEVYEDDYTGPIPLRFCHAHGDTLAEVMAAIEKA